MPAFCSSWFFFHHGRSFIGQVYTKMKQCLYEKWLTIERMYNNTLVLRHGNKLCARIVISHTPNLIRMFSRCVNTSFCFCIPDFYWFIRWSKKLKKENSLAINIVSQCTYEEIKCWLSELNATLRTHELCPDNVLTVVGCAVCLLRKDLNMLIESWCNHRTTFLHIMNTNMAIIGRWN